MNLFKILIFHAKIRRVLNIYKYSLGFLIKKYHTTLIVFFFDLRHSVFIWIDYMDFGL